MNELANQWYQLGSLLIQAGFLIAGVWFADKVLKRIRASQEQMAALIRHAVSGSSTDSANHATAAHRTTPYLSDGWPAATAAPVEPESAPQRVRTAAPWSGLISWLQAPMATPGVGSWRRMVRWLQTPAGS